MKATGRLTEEGECKKQQLVWLPSILTTAKISSALQELTEAHYTTSEQNKDMLDTRTKRDMKDTKTILEFMEVREPFSKDSNLRNIATSVITDSRVNVDKAKEADQNILKTMTHRNTDEYCFKKDNQAITIYTYMISGVIHKKYK